MKKYVFFCVTCLFIISSFIIENSEPAPKPDIASITISNKINEIITGEHHQFEATFSPFDAEAPENYTWRSSNTSIATINSAGLFTAIDEGEVTISLTSVVSRKKGTIELSDEMTITVYPVEIEGIVLDKESLEMINGSTTTLTVSFLPADAKPKDIEWSSSNNLIATVADGVITAHNSSDNVVIITAKVKGTDIEARCNVKVNPIVLSSIRFDTVDPLRWDTLEINLSTPTQLIFVPDNAENKNVIYTSSDSLIATVNANGVITGVSKGRATVTATSHTGGFTANYRVDVVTVADLVTVTVEKVYVTAGVKINAILTNRSSQPVFILNFKLMWGMLNVYHNQEKHIDIKRTLDPFDSYMVESVDFEGLTNPWAQFTIEYKENEYQCIKSIQ